MTPLQNVDDARRSLVFEDERKRLERPTISLGVSACLLGERVRNDGGHKRDPFLADELGRYVEWVPVCPEVEMGLSVPCESMRLEGDPEAPRPIAPESGTDYTEGMKAWAQKRVKRPVDARLHGFVFEGNSPSSGLFRVKVYDEHGVAQGIGTGIFHRAVMNRFPLVPLEEEGRLYDARLQKSFIERIFVYSRWGRTLEENPTPHGIVEFHTAHRLSMMSHSPVHCRKMGCLVARAGSMP